MPQASRGWYAEIYSNWGLDGCKAWLASQLLWDVRQDPRALVDQYYSDFFDAASEPMKRYWERCERDVDGATRRGALVQRVL